MTPKQENIRTERMQTGRFASFFLSPDKPGTTPAPTVKTMFFHFYKAKVLDCALLVQGGPPDRLAGKNHPRCAPVFFSAKPCHQNAPIQNGKPVKSGKNIPMGFIHS